MDSGNCSIEDYQETSQYLNDFQCCFAFNLSGKKKTILVFLCWRQGFGILLDDLFRTGTGSTVSVYETLEPDICNITLNHDDGFSIFFDIHWKLGYDVQRKCGKLVVAELFKCPLAS